VGMWFGDDNEDEFEEMLDDFYIMDQVEKELKEDGFYDSEPHSSKSSGGCSGGMIFTIIIILLIGSLFRNC